MDLALTCTETIEEYLRNRRQSDALDSSPSSLAGPTGGRRCRYGELLAHRAVSRARDALVEESFNSPASPWSGRPARPLTW